MSVECVTWNLKNLVLQPTLKIPMETVEMSVKRVMWNLQEGEISAQPTLKVSLETVETLVEWVMWEESGKLSAQSAHWRCQWKQRRWQLSLSVEDVTWNCGCEMQDVTSSNLWDEHTPQTVTHQASVSVLSPSGNPSCKAWPPASWVIRPDPRPAILVPFRKIKSSDFTMINAWPLSATRNPTPRLSKAFTSTLILYCWRSCASDSGPVKETGSGFDSPLPSCAFPLVKFEGLGSAVGVPPRASPRTVWSFPTNKEPYLSLCSFSMASNCAFTDGSACANSAFNDGCKETWAPLRQVTRSLPSHVLVPSSASMAPGTERR